MQLRILESTYSYYFDFAKRGIGSVASVLIRRSGMVATIQSKSVISAIYSMNGTDVFLLLAIIEHFKTSDEIAELHVQPDVKDIWFYEGLGFKKRLGGWYFSLSESVV